LGRINLRQKKGPGALPAAGPVTDFMVSARKLRHLLDQPFLQGQIVIISGRQEVQCRLELFELLCRLDTPVVAVF